MRRSGLGRGYGYEGFWTDGDDRRHVSGHQGWSIDSAHSAYVEGMLTLGYVGVALHTLALVAAAGGGHVALPCGRGKLAVLPGCGAVRWCIWPGGDAGGDSAGEAFADLVLLCAAAGGFAGV